MMGVIAEGVAEVVCLYRLSYKVSSIKIRQEDITGAKTGKLLTRM